MPPSPTEDLWRTRSFESLVWRSSVFEIAERKKKAEGNTRAGVVTGRLATD